MTAKPHPDQPSLFPGLEAAPAAIRPWRSTLMDAGSGAGVEPEKLEAIHRDLLRRNREFLRGLEIAGVAEEAPEVLRFREADAPLLCNLVFLRWGTVQDIEMAGVAQVAREVVAELAAIRRQILQELDPDQRQRTLVSESRARIPERQLDHELAIAEFALAEELGDVVEIKIPLHEAEPEEEELPPGVLGVADVEALVQASLQRWKAEQERRPLPRQARLRTLLKGIPVVWLHPVCATLDIDVRSFRYRKDREAEIARVLLDGGRLPEIVRHRLSTEERQLLALVVERGGEVPSSTVVRRFGRDDVDGWFWDEEPPTSVLGRLRLHALAFVGKSAVTGRRAVVVPRELREPLGAVFGAESAEPAESADSGLKK